MPDRAEVVAMRGALRRVFSVVAAAPRGSALFVAATAVGVAVVATCLHRLAGMSTTASVVVAASLGLLALAAVAAVSAVVVSVAEALSRMRWVSRGSAQVTPGNLPTASTGDAGQADESPEVWE
jgi:hypothetical protein